MKTLKVLLAAYLSVFLAFSCQKEDAPSPYSSPDKNNTTVKFVLNAKALRIAPTKTYTPAYDKNGFGIYAFRRQDEGTEYIFEKKIDFKNAVYSESENILTVTDKLAIGNYKFIGSYGLLNQSDAIFQPVLDNRSLTEDLIFSLTGTAPISEIFLPTADNASSLPDYPLGVSEVANPTVNLNLNRAVSRVDVVFIKAVKNGDEYIPLAYPEGKNIFDNKNIEQIRMRFSDINNTMNLFGEDKTGTLFSTFDVDLTDLSDRIVIGNDPVGMALLDPDYTDYDNVREADIINGSAHVFGTYLFPNDNTKTAGLEVYIKGEGTEGKTIRIDTDADHKLPLERNKVTLVKIYVLSDNVFSSTDINFEVEIVTVWDPSHQVEKEME